MNNRVSAFTPVIFSKKASHYQSSRPTYPEPVFIYLSQILNHRSTVVEFGCGTGIFTERLMQLGCKIYAVEPCVDMLNECKSRLKSNSNLIFLETCSEDVNLQRSTIDAFLFPQSLHWMDIKKVRQIIDCSAKDKFKIVTLWNSRDKSHSKSAIEYSKIISEFNKDGIYLPHVDTDSYTLLNQLYGVGMYKVYKFSHDHILTRTGVESLILSISDTNIDAYG